MTAKPQLGDWYVANDDLSYEIVRRYTVPTRRPNDLVAEAKAQGSLYRIIELEELLGQMEGRQIYRRGD